MSTIQTDSYQNLLGQNWFSAVNSAYSGYQKLPGGLILMWVRTTGSWDGEGERVAVLPLAVQNIVACMIGTVNNTNTYADRAYQLRNFYGYGFGQGLVVTGQPGYKTEMVLYQNAMAGATGGQDAHIFVVGY
jgi:hypothetical protein